MAEPKEGESFFRKVVKFVANPATDWSNINSQQEDNREAELEKSELKAMVERKRRNDFVRKREFDVLRRLRRDGLSPEQLAALGGTSQIDDTDVRVSETSLRQDVRVKAKIDEIEQQMVGNDGLRNSQDRRQSGYHALPTQAQAFQPSMEQRNAGAGAGAPRPALERAQAAPPPGDGRRELPAALPVLTQTVVSSATAKGGAGASAAIPAKQPAAKPQAAAQALRPPIQPDAIEVSEVVHDPELDEAVIAFANADFSHCEQALTQLVDRNGARYQHGETWRVLFDLYRAIGQQIKFESLALDYANLFGASAPQWFSMPRLVADAAAAAFEVQPSVPRPAGEIGWICPVALDVEAVARLRSVTLQLPLPWVLDWAALKTIEIEAASQLTAVFREWAKQAVEMRWLSGDQLLQALLEAAPTGVRDADPAFWMARLEALRLANRPDQFDEAAIDYCVTYEVSPPSWERAECIARLSGGSLSSTSQPVSIISEVSTGFMESSMLDDVQQGVQVATVELSGQLVGDIGATLALLDQRLGMAPLVSVACSRLIRVDFIAAGDLLNWVLAKRGQDRSVTFTDSHRLVALFFGAMGINEHARIQVRRD